MNAVVEHFQTNMGLYIVLAVVILPPVYYFRKKTYPIIYHAFEYLFYCTVTHVVLAGLIRVFSWFRQETAFKQVDGSIDKNFGGYTTPLNLNFWDKTQYSPTGLFFFEIAVALMILYVVLVIRPTSFKRRNWVISSKKKDGGKKKPRYNRNQSSHAR